MPNGKSLQEKTYPQFSLDQIMSPSPTTITPETTAGEAMQIMRKRRFQHLPVTEKQANGPDKVVGIVARGDLQRVISAFAGSKIETNRDRQTLNIRVRSFMSKPVDTLSPDAGIRECAELLLDKGFNAVPIVEPETGVLVGIVTASDLIEFLHELLGRGLKK